MYTGFARQHERNKIIMPSARAARASVQVAAAKPPRLLSRNALSAYVYGLPRIYLAALLAVLVLAAFIVFILIPCSLIFSIEGHAKIKMCSNLYHVIVESHIGSWWLDHRSTTLRLADEIDQGLKIVIASPGGVGTWDFVRYLHGRGALGAPPATLERGLVHPPTPEGLAALPDEQARQLRAVVFILADPLAAICSLQRRALQGGMLANHHDIYSYLNHRWRHLRFDIELPLVDAMYAQFQAWTDPHLAPLLLQKLVGTGTLQAKRLRAAWDKQHPRHSQLHVSPVVYLRSHEVRDGECLRLLCLRLGTCGAFALGAAAAGSSSAGDTTDPAAAAVDAPCVEAFEARLNADQRLAVMAMRDFPSTCHAARLVKANAAARAELSTGNAALGDPLFSRDPNVFAQNG